MKQLDGMIEVNLSSDIHRESKDESNQNDETYIPTEEDVRIFRGNFLYDVEMTKTVQMKEAYKRPVRKVTKYRTEGKDGREHLNHLNHLSKDTRQQHNQS